jgi:aryl-alcohol dehydrogenase-like predicted oxidoreductase
VQLRPFGRTGIEISELTFGTSPLDSESVDVGEAARSLSLAIERGVNAVESSSARSQSLLGSLLSDNGARHSVHVLARIRSLVQFDLPSPHIPAQQAYPGAHIRAEVDAMLRRLGVDRLASVFLPDWCAEWQDEGDWLETLVSLRSDGKVAAFGVSLFDHDADAGERIVASGAIQCIATMYNIFDPGPAERLLPLCQKHGVAVIARAPLYYGALSPTIRAVEPHADWRRDYFFEDHLRETRSRVSALAADGADLPGSALRFALSHPGVSSVAVGMRTAAQVQQNLSAAEEGPLSTEQLVRLGRHKWLC